MSISGMCQTHVLFVISVLGPHFSMLDKREDFVDFQE